MKRIILSAAAIVAAATTFAQQAEVLSVASDEVQAVINAAIEGPTELLNDNFFIVDPSAKTYAEGTFAAGAADVVATDGEPIALLSYVWEYTTGDMAIKAVSTPNADATSKDAWPKKGNGAIAEDGSWTGNEALNVAGCEPQFLYGVSPKNGNPTASYKDFFEYNSDGSKVHRVYDGPYWEPGCGWTPAKGCYYEFSAAKAGELKVALWVNKNLANNPVYIINEETAELIPAAEIAVVGFMQNNTFEKDENGEACGTLPYILNADYKLVPAATPDANPGNRPFFGYFTFAVEAGAKYMVFSSKSQLGFFGYQFVAAPTPDAISTLEAAATQTIFNIRGERVSEMKAGQAYIVDGKKVIR